MAIESFGRDFRHNVAIVYDAVGLNLVAVPEITVADSWGADRIDPVGIRAAVSRQGCQGRTQTVAAKPDLKTLAVKFFDMRGQIIPNFIQGIFKSPMDFAARLPFYQPDIHIGHQIGKNFGRIEFFFFFPDFASPEYHEGKFIIAGDKTLGAVFIQKDNLIQAGLAEPNSDKFFVCINQGRRFGEPPGINRAEGFGIILERKRFNVVIVPVVFKWRRNIFPGDFRNGLAPGPIRGLLSHFAQSPAYMNAANSSPINTILMNIEDMKI